MVVVPGGAESPRGHWARAAGSSRGRQARAVVGSRPQLSGLPAAGSRSWLPGLRCRRSAAAHALVVLWLQSAESIYLGLLMSGKCGKYLIYGARFSKSAHFFVGTVFGVTFPAEEHLQCFH